MPGIELGALLVVLVGVLVAAWVIRAVAPFIRNAAVGVAVLLGAQVLFGVSISVTPAAVLVVALGGLPGALAVLALSHVGLAFA